MTTHSSDLMKLEILDKEFILLLDQYQQISKSYFSLNDSSSTQYTSLQGRSIIGGNMVLYETMPTLDSCQALCSVNKNCDGAIYDEQTEMCVIKSGDINVKDANNNSIYSIVSEKMNLLIQLKNINEKLYNVLNRSAILVKQMNPNTKTQTKQVSIETQKLSVKYNLLQHNKEELDKLIYENESLENEYNVTTLMVNQSNLSYIFWSIGALIIIIFAIRLYYMD
jgi:hypothetical protein